ncbi:ubiquinone biosynthesis accessory factor UbiJ [Lysobacter sp. A289]
MTEPSHPPSPSPLGALKPAAGRALEGALNRALALDPETRGSLRALDGRRVALRLTSPPLALQVRVNGERLEVGPIDGESEPDLSVRSTLGGLISQLPFLRNDDAPPVGKLRIEGDADLARRLQRLAERFDPDWQRPFAKVFGDVLGVQIANALAAGLRHAQVVAGQLAGSAAEFVTEESRDVVPRAELNAFHDDVDGLRDDVERIAARIARLHTSALGNSASKRPAGSGSAGDAAP